MKFKNLFVLFLFGFLYACAHSPTIKEDVEEKKEVAEQEEINQKNLPNQELTAPILFDFLVGETALQRGSLDVALNRYLKLAKSTRDFRLAKRASEIALHAGDPNAAVQATSLWVQLDPESIEARQTMAALMVNLGNLDAAHPHLEKLLQSEKEKGNVANAFMQLNQIFARNPDKVGIYQLVQQLAVPYKDLPEAQFAISQSAWLANQHIPALSAMNEALKLRPDWEIAAIHKGRILQRTSDPENVHQFYRDYLTKYPNANEVRIAFARTLITDNRNDLANEQLNLLIDKKTTDPEIMLAIGLLATEMDNFDITEKSFKRALELNYKDPDAVHFHLAQIYEETKRNDQAMVSYQLVKAGSRYIPAQIRYADLLASKGQINEARDYLKKIPAANDQQTAHLILAEAQILRKSKSYQEIYEVLTNGLKKLPDYPELLYDRALIADKLGKFTVLEKDLRKLIQLKPDNAHAYNALGYSFAERREHLPEALKLIKKAVELAPDDPFIMDSLGWVHYRMGNISEGLNYLNLAYATRPDPEIAAHLGEVLWAQGAKDNAKDIWRTALEKEPDNEVLLETIERLTKSKNLD